MTPLRRALAMRLGASLCAPMVAGWMAPGLACAARPAPRADSPPLGVDPWLVEAGLTGRWQAALRQDFGWQSQWPQATTADILRQLERGDLAVGLFLQHPLADELDRQGLIHHRRTLGRCELLLVGPEDDPAGLRNERDVARALQQVLLADQARAARWQAPPADSPLAHLVQGLTQHAPSPLKGLRPPDRPHAPGPAYTLLPRMHWRPTRGLRAWAQSDERLWLTVQVACAFRARHPGATLLVDWLGRPLAQSAFRQAAAGWQPAPPLPAHRA